MPAEHHLSARDLPIDEARLAALYAGVSDAVYIEHVASQRILFWSPGAQALFGYGAGEALNRCSAFLRNPGDQPATNAADAAAGSRGWQQYRRADGSLFDAEVCLTLLPSEEGDCAVIVVRPRQAADHRPGMESEGQQGGQVIAHLLRNIANYAVVTTDKGGVICEWNREASRLFGYERSEICGKPISCLSTQNSERALQKAFEDAQDKGTSRYYQWLARKDGQQFYARTMAFALWDDTRVQGFLFLLSDESRAPNQRQMLREKEQMAAIGTAASMLAHEIGNPLNGISATVQLMEHFLGRDNPPPPATLLSSVRDLKSEVGHLTALLSEFKNIAWPQKIAFAPVDLPRLLQRLAGAIEHRSTRQNVAVAIDCAPGLPFLNGDDEKLNQALLQVLDNALDAMPHGGKLQIKAYQRDQTLCIDVIDTGVGIPKNLKAFDLFSSTKPDSIGLGLFMVQQIVLAHGGTITYSSTPGQGTTFHVTFSLDPLADPLSADLIETI